MKISYILQLKDFSIMLGIGAILGIFYGILNLFSIVKKNIVFQIIVDIIFSATALIIFILFINIINMGEIRLFLLAGYIIGFILERISLGKLFAKGFKKVYNCLVNILGKFAKSKFGRIIFK
ncbi:MAG: spore cortex biosynthesis protein YabQ [Christensenellales bacterium]